MQTRSEDHGKDLSANLTLLSKQETFDAGLAAFNKEGIQAITTLKDQLIAAEHEQSDVIIKRYEHVIARYAHCLLPDTLLQFNHFWRFLHPIVVFKESLTAFI